MVEKTFAIIKPDAVKAKISGKIIDLIEQNGFDILKIEKIQLSEDKAKKFYAVHKDKPFFQEVIDFMCSGPVIVMALEKENAIADWRKLMGATNPEQAEDGTIRKLYGTNIMVNCTHGSDAAETAKTELGIFFPDLG
ncbi:nucleoside-diphosphate kinase [Candidatus Dependentiae bacterium]